MSSRSALVRFFVENPILGGMFLITISVVMFVSVSGSGEKYRPFFDGSSVSGRVLEVAPGSGNTKFNVGYAWRDEQGRRHRGEIRSSKVWVGELKAGDSLDLKLSAVDPADAIPTRVLQEKDLVIFLGRPTPSIVYLSPILLLAGALMIVFHRHIGHSLS